MEVEGRGGTRVCGRGHLDMGWRYDIEMVKDTRAPRTTSFRPQWRICSTV